MLKLSIIIPVYKVENYIQKCIESILRQNIYNDDYEVIIIDDGSPDNSVKIVENLLKKINNIIIYKQQNKGLSYGSFSDNFERLRNEFDYFIFNEDDYFLVENKWDEYLIRKYNQLPLSGYLCAMQRDEDHWNDNKIHAGHCFGIASKDSLDKVWEEYGCLPNSKDSNDYDVQEKVQHEFGYSFIKVGLRVYDILRYIRR